MILKKAQLCAMRVCLFTGTLWPKFKYANVTGKSVKFADQVVGLNHVLEDGDILTIVTAR